MSSVNIISPSINQSNETRTVTIADLSPRTFLLKKKNSDHFLTTSNVQQVLNMVVVGLIFGSSVPCKSDGNFAEVANVLYGILYSL